MINVDHHFLSILLSFTLCKSIQLFLADKNTQIVELHGLLCYQNSYRQLHAYKCENRMDGFMDGSKFIDSHCINLTQKEK